MVLEIVYVSSWVMLLRSETALGLQLPDFFSMELDNEGVSKCVVLVATITFGKTNKDGKI